MRAAAAVREAGAMTRSLAKTLVAVSYPLRMAAHLTQRTPSSGRASVVVLAAHERDRHG
jgi:hypothetical protein